MQRNYFSILFFIRRTRLLKNGEAPIGLRITVNGQRAEMQIKRSVAEERWNASKGYVTGKDRKALELNQYLEYVRTKIYQIHRELLQDGKPITAFTIIQKFNGEGESPKMLLEVFREHNKKYRELIDRDYVKGTVLRYERTVRYLEEMLQSQYNLKDIPLKELNHEFVLNFEHFVKVQKNCAQNAAVKYLKNLKKITRLHRLRVLRHQRNHPEGAVPLLHQSPGTCRHVQRNHRFSYRRRHWYRPPQEKRDIA